MHCFGHRLQAKIDLDAFGMVSGLGSVATVSPFSRKPMKDHDVSISNYAEIATRGAFQETPR
jgi:hypothetical protein